MKMMSSLILMFVCLGTASAQESHSFFQSLASFNDRVTQHDEQLKQHAARITALETKLQVVQASEQVVSTEPVYSQPTYSTPIYSAPTYTMPQYSYPVNSYPIQSEYIIEYSEPVHFQYRTPQRNYATPVRKSVGNVVDRCIGGSCGQAQNCPNGFCPRR